MRRIARFVYLVVALIYFLEMGAAFVWELGARRLPQPGEEEAARVAIFVAFFLLAGLIWCAIRVQSCRLSVVVALTVLWLGIYTWFYWFSYFAPAQMTELFLDPEKMRVETMRHYTLATAMYLIVVAAFSILPILKLLEVRRESSKQPPV